MYYVVYGLLYFVSLLPLKALYLLSDLAYLIIYRIMGYRKDVVMNNLKLVFPEKTDSERLVIAKKFYHNFCDNFIETLKLISASPRFLEKHFTGDYSVFDDLYEQGRKCQVLLAHNFNWELASMAVADRVKQKYLAVYMPINNKVFDRIFYKMRTKTGAIFLPATNMKNAMIPHRDDNYILALVADQNPGKPAKSYWFDFFGKPTPFIKGPERGSKAGNIPSIFLKIIKIKRGYYRFEVVMSEYDPASLPDGELTRQYVHYLADFLREHPEMWLWSHRRWKWDWKPEYGEIMK